MTRYSQSPLRALAAMLVCSTLILLSATAFGQDYGQAAAAATNIGYQAAASASQAAQYYQKNCYYDSCGRRYCRYTPVAAPAAAEKTINATGAVNTDNSVTYSYVYNLTQSSQLPAAQGSTILGVSEVADIYGNLDLGALLDQSLRMSAQINSDATQVASGVTATLRDVAAAATRDSETRTKAAAAVAVLQAQTVQQEALIRSLAPADSLHIERRVEHGDGQTHIVPDSPPAAGKAGSGEAGSIERLKAIFVRNCAECHINDKKGNLDLSNPLTLTEQQVSHILERVTTRDPEKAMPPPDKATGQPKSLPWADVKFLFDSASGENE